MYSTVRSTSRQQFVLLGPTIYTVYIVFAALPPPFANVCLAMIVYNSFRACIMCYSYIQTFLRRKLVLVKYFVLGFLSVFCMFIARASLFCGFFLSPIFLLVVFCLVVSARASD